MDSRIVQASVESIRQRKAKRRISTILEDHAYEIAALQRLGFTWKGITEVISGIEGVPVDPNAMRSGFHKLRSSGRISFATPEAIAAIARVINEIEHQTGRLTRVTED